MAEGSKDAGQSPDQKPDLRASFDALPEALKNAAARVAREVREIDLRVNTLGESDPQHKLLMNDKTAEYRELGKIFKQFYEDAHPEEGFPR